jgi:hypothetical protein
MSESLNNIYRKKKAARQRHAARRLRYPSNFFPVPVPSLTLQNRLKPASFLLFHLEKVNVCNHAAPLPQKAFFLQLLLHVRFSLSVRASFRGLGAKRGNIVLYLFFLVSCGGNRHDISRFYGFSTANPAMRLKSFSSYV